MSKPLSLRLVSNLGKSRWWFELSGTRITLDGSSDDYKTRAAAVAEAARCELDVDDAGGVRSAHDSPAPAPNAPDTSNDFLVGVQMGEKGAHVRVLRGLAPGAVLDKAQALRLAAWLVVLVDPDGEAFADTLAAVEST